MSNVKKLRPSVDKIPDQHGTFWVSMSCFSFRTGLYKGKFGGSRWIEFYDFNGKIVHACSDNLTTEFLVRRFIDQVNDGLLDDDEVLSDEGVEFDDEDDSELDDDSNIDFFDDDDDSDLEDIEETDGIDVFGER